MADAIYPLSTFMSRTGLGRAAVRMARRKGLKVKRIGKRSYLKGSDFLEWFDQYAEQVA